MTIDDGEHHLKEARLDLTSVLVTPLDESYRGIATVFHLADGKPLAVSKEEGEMIKALIRGSPKGRTLVMSPYDGWRIRVSIAQ